MQQPVWNHKESITALLAVLVLCFASGLVAGSKADIDKNFIMLYQFTGTKERHEEIDAFMYPVLPVKISYEPRFRLKHNDSSQKVPAKKFIDLSTQKLMHEAIRSPHQYVILDIETWQTNLSVSSKEAQVNMGKIIKLVNEVKKRIPPGYEIGNYGSPVFRDYRATRDGNKARLNKWRQRNSELWPLADVMDIFYPSLYTFELDKVERWVKYARTHIAEARKQARRDQKVIAFIWPKYHDNSKYKDIFISYEFWKVQLETMLDVADGVVIWSNHNERGGKESGWYLATREFIESLRQRGITINGLS